MNRNVIPAIASSLMIAGFLLIVLSLLISGPGESTISGGGVVVVGPLVFAFGKGIPSELILALVVLSVILLIPYLISIAQLFRLRGRGSEGEV